MKRILLLGLACLPAVLDLAAAGEPPAGTAANAAPVPEGWLQLTNRELVLDFRQGSLDYDARQDAGEVLLSILKVLLEAHYKVRLSPGYISDEINYYRLNLNQETPPQMTRGILSGLENVRASGVLDWEAFRRVAITNGDLMAAARHLPWMAPPFDCKSVSLAGSGDTNLPCLHFSLGWVGRRARGALQHDRRPGGLPGERVLLTGEDTLWAYWATLRLQNAGQTLFVKNYPLEQWQRTYVDPLEYPVQKTTLQILHDLLTGLKPKPLPPAEPSGKKRTVERTKQPKI